MATHSSVLAWRIPGMVEPGGLSRTRLKQLSSSSSPVESESCSVVSDCLRPHGLYTVQGILQTSKLERVAIPFSRGSSQSQGLNPGLLPCRWNLYQLIFPVRFLIINVNILANVFSNYLFTFIDMFRYIDMNLPIYPTTK